MFRRLLDLETWIAQIANSAISASLMNARILSLLAKGSCQKQLVVASNQAIVKHAMSIIAEATPFRLRAIRPSNPFNHPVILASCAEQLSLIHRSRREYALVAKSQVST
jgi:hypothetical protein